jgi:putative redox protein
MEVSVAASKEGKVIWENGLAFEGVGASGFRVQLDSPQAEGGPTGFSPMELMLVTLAGCTAMDVISILKKKRQDVTGFEVISHGVRAEDYPQVYTDITLEYVVRGRNVDPKAVERAIELSETKYCSVSAMLNKTAKITTIFRVEEAA